MSQLMTGMFWAGLVMAVPAVLVSIGVIALVYKQQREAGEAEIRKPSE